MRRLPPLASVFLVVALFGCALTVDQAPPSATAGPDDLRGTWAGTWGGAPVQLVIVEQIELGERSGGARVVAVSLGLLLSELRSSTSDFSLS
jgi:hypothetical protein